MGWEMGVNGNAKSKRIFYDPVELTCCGWGKGVAISTALSTLVDHSSSPSSSSRNAMLNVLRDLRLDRRCEAPGSCVESRLSEITDPEGVPSGVSYIAEAGDSVEVPELYLLKIGGGGVRVRPLSL